MLLHKEKKRTINGVVFLQDMNFWKQAVEKLFSEDCS